MLINSISKRISMGYVLVVSIFLVIVVISANRLNIIYESSRENFETQFPAVANSASLQNGLNASLSALRGYIILGEDRFKEDRKRIWEKEILSSLNALKENLRRDLDTESFLHLEKIN